MSMSIDCAGTTSSRPGGAFLHVQLAVARRRQVPASPMLVQPQRTASRQSMKRSQAPLPWMPRG